MGYKRYIAILMLLVVLVLLALAVVISIADPYWLFRENPRWALLYGGHNRALDIRHRFAKSLQVVVQRPKVLLIGSSRVYRGMDTGRYTEFQIYNFGISSLRIREVDGYLRHAQRWAPLAEIVFGLDYFMFDTEMQFEAGFDSSTASFPYFFKALAVSLLTRTAIQDVRLALSGERAGDGYWTRSGYKATRFRPPEAVRRIWSSFYTTQNRVTAQEYRVFREILETAQKQARITLFISPLNQSMIHRMKSKGRYGDFVVWRQKLKSAAVELQIPLYDFSEDNPFFYDDLSAGSTRYWIDTSHYAPEIGEWILTEIGLLPRLAGEREK